MRIRAFNLLWSGLLLGLFLAPTAPGVTRRPSPGMDAEWDPAGTAQKDSFQSERKTPSFWRRVRAENPADQWAQVQQRLEAERFRAAGRTANALVQHWHDAPEAPKAQQLLAEILEHRGRYARAFREYQYLLDHFSGDFSYPQIVERQFRLASTLLARLDRRLFRGANTDQVLRMFEQIVRNAPQGPRAPEAQMRVGQVHEREKNYPLAIQAYEALMVSHPGHPLLESAAFHTAQSHYRQAMRYPRDESGIISAFSALRLLLQRHPRHPERPAIERMHDAVYARLTEMHFERARFYDRIRGEPEAARIAYGEFLRRFPDAEQAPEVRRLLEALPVAVAAPVEPSADATTGSLPRERQEHERFDTGTRRRSDPTE